MDAARAAQLGIGAEVVHHLGGQAADVDGVGGGQAHALARQQMLLFHSGKNVLHAGLGVVKIAPDGTDADVAALLGLHLPLLHGADAAVGVEYDDLRARHVLKARHGGLSRVAAGGGQDQDLVLYAALFAGGGHQPGQHAECRILEGAGGAAEQLQHRVVAQGDGGGQVGRLKFIGIGRPDKAVHLLFGKGRQQRRQDLPRHGQGVQRQKRLPVQLDLRQGGHGIQSAVRGEALQDRLGRRGVQVGVSGTLVFHHGVDLRLFSLKKFLKKAKISPCNFMMVMIYCFP